MCQRPSLDGGRGSQRPVGVLVPLSPLPSLAPVVSYCTTHCHPSVCALCRFQTQRQHPRLCLIQPAVTPAGAQATVACNRSDAAAPRCPVALHTLPSPTCAASFVWAPPPACPSGLVLSADGVSPITVPLLTRRTHGDAVTQRTVVVWGTDIDSAVDQGDAVAAWLSAFVGQPNLRLVYFDEVCVCRNLGILIAVRASSRNSIVH